MVSDSFWVPISTDTSCHDGEKVRLSVFMYTLRRTGYDITVACVNCDCGTVQAKLVSSREGSPWQQLHDVR